MGGSPCNGRVGRMVRRMMKRTVRRLVRKMVRMPTLASSMAAIPRLRASALASYTDCFIT
jgi:hypothetical protein